jgi:hypothetical protein
LKIDIQNTNRISSALFLLTPGLLNAFLTLLISSNFLFPCEKDTSFFLLNTAQLLSFGITVSKYAVDQMILTRLKSNERATLTAFYLKKVIPLTILFSFFIFYTNGILIAAALMICIFFEVFTIVVIFEQNVSGRYFSSFKLNLMGYPLIYILYIILSLLGKVVAFQIVSIFIVSCTLRLAIAYSYRGTGGGKDILLLSNQVPLQQVGNYLLFKGEQFLIASNFLQLSILKIPLPTDILFYSRFTDIYSGIATSMAPVLSKTTKRNSAEISFVPLLKTKGYIFIHIIAIVVQILSSVILLSRFDKLHWLLLFPYCMITLLIVPSNMITLEYYRQNKLKYANIAIAFALTTTIIFLIINSFIKSVLLFSFIVPVQLMVFIFIYYAQKRKRNV